MCVAIYKPIGLELDRETLKNCFITNPDGCGFSYIEEETGEIRIQKFMELAPFLTAYEEKQTRYLNTSPFLVHFRIKTHGQKDLDNCHPFLIDSEHVFIHNGVIRNVPDCPDKKKSDTRMFKELFLRKLPAGWFGNTAVHDLIEEYIGSFSKLAIMNREGVVELYNESKGSWKEGVWFSNLLWEPSTKKWHADTCLNCGAYIRNNVYANTQSVSFCSIACKNEYLKRPYSWQNLCEMCERRAYITVCHGNQEYHYCSESCRKTHRKILDKQSTKQESKKDLRVTDAPSTYLECCYCGIHHPAYACVELEIAYANAVEKEFMCVHCIPDAIAACFITDSPELAKATSEILAEIRERKEGKVAK